MTILQLANGTIEDELLPLVYNSCNYLYKKYLFMTYLLSAGPEA